MIFNMNFGEEIYILINLAKYTYEVTTFTSTKNIQNLTNSTVYLKNSNIH